MSNSSKDILITPNTGSSTDDPKIEFTGADASSNTTITLEMRADGTLSFNGNIGELMAIKDAADGLLHLVSDVSGNPLFSVDSDGTTRLAQTYGKVAIGSEAPTEELSVEGNMMATHMAYVKRYIPLVPDVPFTGTDVRRMWVVSASGQFKDTWTDANSNVNDGAGIRITPVGHTQTAACTHPVAMGAIQPYELADGGHIDIVAYGTYEAHTPAPKLVAKIKVGDQYIFPDYSTDTGFYQGFTLASGVASEAFDWSYATMGSNTIGGYEALNAKRTEVDDTGSPQGRFSWKLNVRIWSLGRTGKHPIFHTNTATIDTDHITEWSSSFGTYDTTHWVVNSDKGGRTYRCTVSHNPSVTSDTEPGVGADWEDYWQEVSGNLMVEATMEFGGLNINIGEPFTWNNPFSANATQYNPFLDLASGSPGIKRGQIYSFGGQQYLCHAPSETTALGAGDTFDSTTWSEMLAEEAPGIGAHWKEFFVPLVTKKTMVGWGYMDHSSVNELVLELGGAFFVDTDPDGAEATNYVNVRTYGTGNTYSAESYGGASSGLITDSGKYYAAKVTMTSNSTYDHMVNGTHDDDLRAAPTAAVSGSNSGHRFWRELGTNPEDLEDKMFLYNSSAFLFGGRKGTAQKRIR